MNDNVKRALNEIQRESEYFGQKIDSMEEQKEALMRELEKLETTIDVYRDILGSRQVAADYITDNAEDFEPDDEINLNEIYRSIEEEAEYNYQRAEENSLRNAWQQDLIDLYRFER